MRSLSLAHAVWQLAPDPTGEMGRIKIRPAKGLFRPKQKKGGDGFEESYKEEIQGVIPSEVSIVTFKK